MVKFLLRPQIIFLFLVLLVIIASGERQNNQGNNVANRRKKPQQNQPLGNVNNKNRQKPNKNGSGGGGVGQKKPRPNVQSAKPNRKPKPNQNLDQHDEEPAKKRVVIKQIPNLGRVRGRIVKSEWTGKDIMQFLDLPYGKSPSGAKRFKPSEPVEPWQGTLNAIRPHLGCPSLQDIEVYDILESKNIDVEDCLRLTISTKSLSGQAPVMVYIHGDFLYDGSNVEAAPGYLLEKDVVLVSVRYRLGPFGFLSTMTDEIPGNAAVHDLILALEWIQKHIAVFGGDPKRVTLFGQVGGSALINVLTMSPLVADELFHRVIYQSASALTPAFITDNPVASAKDIARFAGCKNPNKVEAVNKCMKKLNTTALLTAFNAHGDAKATMGIGSYGSVQMVIGGPSGVLPEHPGKLLAADKFKAYPTMGGAVKHGGTFILKDIYIDNFNETIIDDKFDGLGYIDHIIEQTNGADPTGEWKKYAQEEMFNEMDIKNGTFYRMAPGLIDMCSVISFKNPVLLSMQSNAKKLPNNTFLYSFDYQGELNRYTTSDDDESTMPFELGVSLTDDNLYLFPWPRYSLINSLRDIKMSKRMVAYWTSFAATGVPQAPEAPEWPPMNDETGPYMKLDRVSSIGDSYIDEFDVALREAKMGYNLVNQEFFDSLVDINNSDDNEEGENEDEDDGEEETQGRGQSVVLIARRKKQ